MLMELTAWVSRSKFRRSQMHAASSACAGPGGSGAAANAWEDDLTVRTDSGWVRGSLEEDLRTDRPISAPVRSWRGIPFGADTGGANRFMPAQKVAPWEGVRECKQWLHNPFILGRTASKARRLPSPRRGAPQ